MLSGASRLNGGVEGKQVGLVGNVVDDADFLGDLLHGGHRLLNGLAPFGGLQHRVAGHAVGDLGVLGVLIDAGAHLLDRGAGLFNAGCLLAGGLAQCLRRVAHLIGGIGQVVGGVAYLFDDIGQRSDGPVEAVFGLAENTWVGLIDPLGQIPLGERGGDAHHIFQAGICHMGEAIQQLGYPLDVALTILQRNLVAEVALFDSGSDQGLDIRDQGPQFLDHVIHRHQELTRFIVGLYLDRYIQIAIGQTIGHAQSLFDRGDDAFD